MLIARSAVDTLAARLARRGGPVRSASVAVEADPLDLVRAGWSAVGHASFFASPDGRIIGGLGAALRVNASGMRRFATLDESIRGLDPDIPVVVGFAFDPEAPPGADWDGYPAASAVVPEIAIVREAGASRLHVTLAPGSDGHHLLALLAGLAAAPPASTIGAGAHRVEEVPQPADWRRLVGDAVAAIESGAFDKTVLARTVVVRSDRVAPSFDLVARLRDRYPGCWIFGWQEGGSTFVGASPELLVARRGSNLRVEPLAGSAPRGEGPDEDRRIGDGLLASSKDREEHRIVVDDAVRRLQPFVDDVIRPPGPQLQRFATVQHLATPISGRTDARLLAVADALHPTPAVGGSPRASGLAFIEKVEGIDRGWYAGGIGWADASGDGEVAVALRCALVTAGRAVLFAGNGIVAGSDPEAEVEETRLKLKPMLDVLTGT